MIIRELSKHPTLVAAIPFIFILMGIFLVWYNQQAATKRGVINRQISTENNAYLRTIACISSVTPTERTPAYVKSCYETAEGELHIKIDRFGGGK